MSLMAFFEWCEATTIGVTIRESLWAFAVTESLHLLGLAMMGGAVLMVNLRMLGLVLRSQSIAEVATEVRPWMNRSLALLVLTGLVLFISEPMKLYYSNPFWLKMEALILALIFTYTIWGKIASNPDRQTSSMWPPLVAVVSLVLWFTVGASGRWIGFSG